MVLHFLLQLISWFLFVYLAFCTVYLCTMAVAGLSKSRYSFSVHPEKKKILILIPSYKEDNIIQDTAFRASRHNYPPGSFSVMVIADKLAQTTMDGLRSVPVHVLPVDENMKSRSIHQALKNLPGVFDIIMLLDADNIMQEGCLERINSAFHQGFSAVQCHRTAKNRNSPVALLDAMSEEINMNLFRRGPARLGLSAAPVGSGMAFETGLLTSIFSSSFILSNPGEDREIDMQLMKRGIRLEFIDDAYVLDEKVSSRAVFERQRVRWLEAQISHVRRFFDADMREAPGSTEYYMKFLQTLLLPRILTIGLFALILCILAVQWISGGAWWHPGPTWWLACMAFYAGSLLISIPRSFYGPKTLRALLHLPGLLLSMVKALLKVKKNRKEFIHTPKSYTSE
jgi:cellulose synthase/poly-beta-1,6-N-acetylglucosamine synthase-like glycosyltransferase